MLTLKNFNKKLLPISNLSATAWEQQITLKWTDPSDAWSTTWASTKLVRKTGSAPTTSSDGTLVLTETTRNQYSSTWYVNTWLTNWTTYYYKAFSVDNNWNEIPSNSVNAIPETSWVNEFTVEEYTSSVMQEWVSDYAPDMSELENLLWDTLVSLINSQLGSVLHNYSPLDPIWTITKTWWWTISATSSPLLSPEGYATRYTLCLPIDVNWNVIIGNNIDYIYNYSGDYWYYFPSEKYLEWHNLWAVAVDILWLQREL